MLGKLGVFLFVAAVSAGAAFGQSTFGTILGTVADASGAVIGNAAVKVINTDEGTSRTLTTDANGNYEDVDVKAGHYAVEASNAGFKTTRVDGLDLGARQTLRVDVTLTVGQFTQHVEVTGESVGVITTETETISSTYNSLEITSLPTNYRASGNGNSPYYLLEILPGVQTDQSGNLSIQGGLQSQSQFSVDGISITNVTGNSPLHNAFPSAEDIAEFKVQGVGSPAEFQDPGDVTTTSKGGTNDLHGSGFWYTQNAALNALPFGAVTKPSQIANDFGGSLGGPVVIPHLYNGKNKSFFYGDYEGFRLPRTSTIENTVPTAAMKHDDENQVVELFARCQGERAHRLGLVHFAIAQETPDFARRGYDEAAIFEVAHEARLIDGINRAEAHGNRGETPEIRHQPGVRVGRKPRRVAQFVAEILEVILRQPPFQEGARVNARRSVALEINQIAGLLAVFGVEKVVEAHFEQRGQRSVGGNVAADTGVVFILAHHHGHGVPPDEALDAAFHGAVAGVGHFVFHRDGIDVRGIQVSGEIDAASVRARGQLLQQVAGAVGPGCLDHLVERLQPLIGFLRIQIHNPFSSCLVHVLLL